MPEQKTQAKLPLSERLKELMMEYGSIALYVYFAIFALVLGGFAIAITMGFHTKGGASALGTLGAAWLATKLTQPLRFLATFVVTPVVAKVLRLKKSTPTLPSTPESPPEAISKS